MSKVPGVKILRGEGWKGKGSVLIVLKKLCLKCSIPKFSDIP